MIAGVAAVGAAAAAGLYRFTDLFRRHYAPTPYDDLLGQLVDREQAARLGAKVAGGANAGALAARLRAALTGGLTAAAIADAGAGRVQDVDGWLLPDSVALLSALAARA
ncbi:MAG: hypothetical protein JWP16_2577 [Alphaproteobacteria bacterium]|nr:hypothetical protein [Alphaproteobacteria bacterium]MDB5741537.1 hypothetical protein [Alphaproteobacteria bacterium]